MIHSNTMYTMNTHYSDSSIQTIPEFNSRKQKFFQILLIILYIINSVIGLCIDTKVIFKSENKFEKIELLKVYYYGYTYLLGFIIGISVSVGLFSVIVRKIIRLCNSSKNNSQSNSNNTSKYEEENINFNSDEGEYNFINISVVVFIFCFILGYIIALPTGIYLVYHLLKNNTLKEVNRFYLLYLFLTNNIILGVVILILFIYVIFFIHIRISGKQRIRLDEELMANVEREVEKSQQVSGKIPIDPSLIKINKLFNKQATPKSFSQNNSTANINHSQNNSNNSNNSNNNYNSFKV